MQKKHYICREDENYNNNMDSQGRVAFQFQSLSYQPVAEGMYLVFLKETNGNRLFPISLDEKQKSFIELTTLKMETSLHRYISSRMAKHSV